MKRTFLCIILTLFATQIYANNEQIVIALEHKGGYHSNFPVPAEMPDVYYNNVSQTIIIDGTGEVEYYDVEIIDLTSLDTVILTQVNGYYDTIDISSLPNGEYVITIDAPTGNSFEGFFSTY